MVTIWTLFFTQTTAMYVRMHVYTLPAPLQCHVLLPPLTMNSNPIIEVLLWWELYCSFEVQACVQGRLCTREGTGSKLLMHLY